MFTISLGFPLANALLGNPDYNSISRLSNSSIPVFALDGLAPELVWDYGKATKHKDRTELLHMDLGSSFGVLTYPREKKDILKFLDENYRVEFVETFDLNPVDSSRRSYKDRLKADYYIVSKLLP
jgi:hypothetical protein